MNEYIYIYIIEATVGPTTLANIYEVKLRPCTGFLAVLPPSKSPATMALRSKMVTTAMRSQQIFLLLRHIFCCRRCVTTVPDSLPLPSPIFSSWLLLQGT